MFPSATVLRTTIAIATESQNKVSDVHRAGELVEKREPQKRKHRTRVYAVIKVQLLY